jgi:hypothetical protein
MVLPTRAEIGLVETFPKSRARSGLRLFVSVIIMSNAGQPNHATTRLGASRIICAGNTDVGFGSVAEVQHMNHLAAPLCSEPAVRIRFFKFPDRATAFTGTADHRLLLLLSDELPLPAMSGHSANA